MLDMSFKHYIPLVFTINVKCQLLKALLHLIDKDSISVTTINILFKFVDKKIIKSRK